MKVSEIVAEYSPELWCRYSLFDGDRSCALGIVARSLGLSIVSGDYIAIESAMVHAGLCGEDGANWFSTSIEKINDMSYSLKETVARLRVYEETRDLDAAIDMKWNYRV